MNLLKRGSKVLLGLCLAGCSGPMVRTHHDKTARFSEFKTYAWTSPAGHFAKGLPENPDLDARIQSAINDEMKTKGLTPATADRADLQLSYTAATEEEVDAATLKNYETAQFMGLTYTMGSLLITMTHGTPPVEVWQGSAQATVDLAQPLAERERRLREAVKALLKNFPPKT